MNQGQPKTIILIILVVLTNQMLHTKFQGHQSVGSGEEDFFKVFYHIRVWRPCWSSDKTICITFLSNIKALEVVHEIWLQSV